MYHQFHLLYNIRLGFKKPKITTDSDIDFIDRVQII
jgi:hypothetical protein